MITPRYLKRPDAAADSRERIVSPRAKATKATAWRESETFAFCERQIHWARRNGVTLRVVLRAPGDVVAVVSRTAELGPGHEMHWPVTLSDERVVDATIALAQRWAEKTADELAGAR